MHTKVNSVARIEGDLFACDQVVVRPSPAGCNAACVERDHASSAASVLPPMS